MSLETLFQCRSWLKKLRSRMITWCKTTPRHKYSRINLCATRSRMPCHLPPIINSNNNLHFLPTILKTSNSKWWASSKLWTNSSYLIILRTSQHLLISEVLTQLTFPREPQLNLKWSQLSKTFKMKLCSTCRLYINIKKKCLRLWSLRSITIWIWRSSPQPHSKKER